MKGFCYSRSLSFAHVLVYQATATVIGAFLGILNCNQCCAWDCIQNRTKPNSTIPNIIEIRYDVILFCALFGNTERGEELTLSMAGVKEKGVETKGTMFCEAHLILIYRFTIFSV